MGPRTLQWVNSRFVPSLRVPPVSSINVAMLLYSNCDDHPLTHRTVRSTIFGFADQSHCHNHSIARVRDTEYLLVLTTVAKNAAIKQNIRTSGMCTERTIYDSTKNNKHTHLTSPSHLTFSIYSLNSLFANFTSADATSRTNHTDREPPAAHAQRANRLRGV